MVLSLLGSATCSVPNFVRTEHRTVRLAITRGDRSDRTMHPSQVAAGDHPPYARTGTSKLGRNICKGGHHETVHIGHATRESGHRHGRRGGQLLRLERKREGTSRERATIRLLPAAATVPGYEQQAQTDGAAGIGSEAGQE